MTAPPGRPKRPAALTPRWPAGSAAAAPTGAPPPLLRPQRPLHEAARDQARRATPAGLGLDSDTVRLAMVAKLRREGLADARVIAALSAVPRHVFVDTALAHQAYEDTALPIGLGQTISKPSVVGRMLELLLQGERARQPDRPLRILEIGTGCGYQAALLATLARQVVSIERLQPLHLGARSRLDALGVRHVRLVWGDGRAGHAPSAPYDAIISAAGGADVPPAWLEQLAVGGRLVAPVASDGARGPQALTVIDRGADGWQRRQGEIVQFVPLESGKA
jgi:protein-L-isoaspartate(D-aspartate) O-methyltransferase